MDGERVIVQNGKLGTGSQVGTFAIVLQRLNMEASINRMPKLEAAVKLILEGLDRGGFIAEPVEPPKLVLTPSGGSETSTEDVTTWAG